MASTSTMHLTLVLLCLVVSHAHGSRRVLRWAEDSDVSPSTTSCPTFTSGHTNGNKVPIVHRLSPCSPLAGSGAPKHGKPSVHEILHRDGLRMQYLSQVQAATSAAAAAPAAAPAPLAGTPASGLSVPARQNAVRSIPGVFDYTVLAGYGTPAQQLPLFFDFSGMSNFRCKPCSSGSSGEEPCEVAFDPSMSSSFRGVPCGSPNCDNDSPCSADGTCTFTFTNSTFLFGNGTVVTDTLTLSPSLTFEDIVVGCMQINNMYGGNAIGNIDLGRSPKSLASRVLQSAPSGTAAFSYCLPADTDTHGFLTIAPALSEYSGHAGIKYVPLVTNPDLDFYYVDLVAIAVNGKDLPLPPALFRENGTMMEPQMAFTHLSPPIYAALRDEFRKEMAQYQPVPAFGTLDTCYNFSLSEDINLPSITLKFGNGETMYLDDRQFMYFFRDHLTDGFPFGCLAFAEAPYENFQWNYLGSQLQRTKEIVYDVRGGQVAFVPSRCGLR